MRCHQLTRSCFDSDELIALLLLDFYSPHFSPRRRSARLRFPVIDQGEIVCQGII